MGMRHVLVLLLHCVALYGICEGAGEPEFEALVPPNVLATYDGTPGSSSVTLPCTLSFTDKSIDPQNMQWRVDLTWFKREFGQTQTTNLYIWENGYDDRIGSDQRMSRVKDPFEERYDLRFNNVGIDDEGEYCCHLHINTNPSSTACTNLHYKAFQDDNAHFIMDCDATDGDPMTTTIYCPAVGSYIPPINVQIKNFYPNIIQSEGRMVELYAPAKDSFNAINTVAWTDFINNADGTFNVNFNSMWPAEYECNTLGIVTFLISLSHKFENDVAYQTCTWIPRDGEPEFESVPTNVLATVPTNVLATYDGTPGSSSVTLPCILSFTDKSIDPQNMQWRVDLTWFKREFRGTQLRNLYIWENGYDDRIDMSETRMSRVKDSFEERYNLRFNNVRAEDEGEYCCYLHINTNLASTACTNLHYKAFQDDDAHFIMDCDATDADPRTTTINCPAAGSSIPPMNVQIKNFYPDSIQSEGRMVELYAPAKDSSNAINTVASTDFIINADGTFNVNFNSTWPTEYACDTLGTVTFLISLTHKLSGDEAYQTCTWIPPTATTTTMYPPTTVAPPSPSATTTTTYSPNTVAPPSAGTTSSDSAPNNSEQGNDSFSRLMFIVLGSVLGVFVIIVIVLLVLGSVMWKRMQVRQPPNSSANPEPIIQEDGYTALNSPNPVSPAPLGRSNTATSTPQRPTTINHAGDSGGNAPPPEYATVTGSAEEYEDPNGRANYHVYESPT